MLRYQHSPLQGVYALVSNALACIDIVHDTFQSMSVDPLSGHQNDQCIIVIELEIRIRLTWCSGDGCQQLEARSSSDDLGPLGQVQVAVGQQGHQGCQDLRRSQIEVLYDQPLALCHGLQARTHIGDGVSLNACHADVALCT